MARIHHAPNPGRRPISLIHGTGPIPLARKTISRSMTSLSATPWISTRHHLHPMSQCRWAASLSVVAPVTPFGSPRSAKIRLPPVTKFPPMRSLSCCSRVAAARSRRPVFSPVAGTYTNGQNVSITTATRGAAMRFTADGSTPRRAMACLYGPIAVNSSATIRALGYMGAMTEQFRVHGHLRH